MTGSSTGDSGTTWWSRDLVVEVGSPGTRRTDERVNQRLYERFAVAEYWIVDPDLDVIKVFRPRSSRSRRT